MDSINLLADKIDAKRLINGASMINLTKTIEYLQGGVKLEKVSIGQGMQELTEVGLASDDFKQCQDAIDKASITLGINQRHATSSVNIANQNQQQAIINPNEISKAIAEGLPN